MSDAPEAEVDSEIVVLDCEDSCCAVYVRDREGKEIHGDLVSADFARRLVSERDEERAECKLYRSRVGVLMLSLESADKELSTLRAQVAELRQVGNRMHCDIICLRSILQSERIIGGNLGIVSTTDWKLLYEKTKP